MDNNISFSEWHDNLIGTKMFTNGPIKIQTIKNIEEGLDSHYPCEIRVSFQETSFGQLFSSKEHLLNWIKIYGDKE